MDADNLPDKLGFGIKYELADDDLVGVALTSTFVPYSPPSYYPYTSDGINNRSYGQKMSPAEKYDLAFSGWQPEESFWSLDRLTNTSDAEFDQDYYDLLGPVASWEHMHHGLGRLHDGWDNDRDGLTDLDDDDAEGLESWFGYCNGNTAASLCVPGPVNDVEWNGVRFTTNDIMALLAAVYYDDRSTMAGLRCESLAPHKDEYGRYLNQPWYRKDGESDLKLFEIVNGPYFMDYSYEKIGYQVRVDERASSRWAVIRLAKEEFEKYRQEVKKGEISYDYRNWEEIEFSIVGQGCRDTNPATVYLVVTNLLGLHGIPFAIDADSGSHVWNYPIYQAQIQVQERIDMQEANRLLGVDPEQQYPFNDNARKFAHVELVLEESNYMKLEMVLELDQNEKVLGGEWIGRSRTSHPDFIWAAKGADSNGFNTEGTYVTFGDDQLDGRSNSYGVMEYRDAPDLAFSDVRRLLAMSRTQEDESYSEHPGTGADLPEGQTIQQKVQVEEQAQVREALVYLDIEADHVPGLAVRLTSPAGTVVNLFEVPPDRHDWLPGHSPQGHQLGVIRGVAHPMPLVEKDGKRHAGLLNLNDTRAGGEWTLEIENRSGGDARLNDWSLWLTSGP